MRCLFEYHTAHDKDCVNDFATANCERNAPESVGTLFYLWEPTTVREAIETEWIFVSLDGLSSSYWCQQDSVFARFTAGLRRGKMYMSCTASRRKPPRSPASHNLLKPCPARLDGVVPVAGGAEQARLNHGGTRAEMYA